MSRRAGAVKQEAPTIFFSPASVPPPHVSLPTSVSVHQTPTVKRVETVCSAPYQQGGGQPQRSYVSHSLFRENQELSDDSRGVLCMHCVHPFSGHAVRLPLDYRPETKQYVVFGTFCSVACAKRYAIEHPNYNTPHLMTNLGQMAREMGFLKPILPAPPQMRLRVFGGDLSIEQFRNVSPSGIQVVAHHAPFITWSMVFEERRRVPLVHGGDVDNKEKEEEKDTFPGINLPISHQPPVPEERWQVRGLRVPDTPAQSDQAGMDTDVYQPAPAMYLAFLDQRKQQDGAGTATAKTEASSSSSVAAAASTSPDKTRGSTMKNTGSTKRQKTTAKTATTTAKSKVTKTSTADVKVPVVKTAPVDPKRGSLRAFMKQRNKPLTTDS